MKSILKKKFVTGSFTLSVLICLTVYFVFETKCFGVHCGSDLIRGILLPSFWFFVGLSGVLSIFLFFQEQIFKSWLRHIAWWYILLLTYFVLATPVYSSNIMQIDRGPLALYGMMLLGIISVLYVWFIRWKGITK
jgi:hypothetical protein